MSGKRRDYAATALGIITSLVTALTLIDFNKIDIQNPNDIVKLLVVCLPALGGGISQIKKKEA